MVPLMNMRNAAIWSAAVLLMGAFGVNVAEARPGARGHVHHGGGGRAIFFAAPIIAGAYLASRYYYYPPSYYYPPAAYYPPPPPVYIEQPVPYAIPPQSQYSVPPQSQGQPQSQAYWYYCPTSRAYYPHVQSCSTDWQRVAPQPPPG
jgi:hypothetical protein